MWLWGTTKTLMGSARWAPDSRHTTSCANRGSQGSGPIPVPGRWWQVQGQPVRQWAGHQAADWAMAPRGREQEGPGRQDAPG